MRQTFWRRPPIMMYSVLVAAAYILSMKAITDRKRKNKA